MRQGHEVVVVDRRARPPVIDLRVHRLDRPEELHRLVHEVGAQVEEDSPGVLRRRCSRHRGRITGRHRSNRDSNRSTVPSTPSPISRRTVRKSPSQRRFWNTVNGTPRSCASPTTSRPSAEMAASGLSTTTGSPAATASRAIARCHRLGVATTITSTATGIDQLVGAVEQRRARVVAEDLRAPVRVGGHDGGQRQAVRRRHQWSVEDPPGQPVAEQTDPQR